jgi:hypothetical protein
MFERCSLAENSFESIVVQAQQLPPEERLRLIKSVVDSLMASGRSVERHHLVYGEFRGAQMSTEDDFSVAEWPCVDREIDGP